MLINVGAPTFGRELSSECVIDTFVVATGVIGTYRTACDEARFLVGILVMNSDNACRMSFKECFDSSWSFEKRSRSRLNKETQTVSYNNLDGRLDHRRLLRGVRWPDHG